VQWQQTKNISKIKPDMSNNTDRSSYIKLIIAGVVILLILGGGIAAITLTKDNKFNKETKERATDLKEGPVVKISVAKYSTAPKQIVLIGEAKPYESTTIYARISGYMDKIYVDKGDKVTQGQLLATITNPEIDQQYIAAVADLENKKKISDRDQKLLVKKYISQEEAELSSTSVALAQATLKSLNEQQGYKSLRAPFSGTVTARYADPGALIQNAINSQTSAQPVVTIADLNRLRVYVYAEQNDAAFIKVGYVVDITLTDQPDVHIKGNVTRVAGELDERTRMMTVEIDIDNRDQKIIPGSFVQVHITGPLSKEAKIEVPSTALVFHKQKSMLAIVDSDNVVHFKEVKVGENTGDKVVILSGAQIGDRVALSVGESIVDGQKVRIDQ
jgi:membrane fusion protein (multidrug efflux system)